MKTMLALILTLTCLVCGVPQLGEAFSGIAEAEADQRSKPGVEAVGDLPLIQVPPAGAASDLMAVEVTGDGGWGVTDRGIARALSTHGIPVVGLNSLQYFWKRKTPEQTSIDMERIILHYMVEWGKKGVILIGYSLGADVLPFAISRLPADTRAKIQLVALLGPSDTVDFEFHFTDWFTNKSRSTSLPVRPEIEKLKGMKMLCFYGMEDKSALCPTLEPGLVRSMPLRTGHRFGRDFEPIVDAILQEIR